MDDEVFEKVMGIIESHRLDFREFFTKVLEMSSKQLLEELDLNTNEALALLKLMTEIISMMPNKH